jgi:hypothetical protein
MSGALRDALEPFAKLAGAIAYAAVPDDQYFDIHFADGDEACFNGFTAGDIRRARKAFDAGPEQTLANASLIAAAHAMYEALEGLLRAVDDGEAMDRVPFDDARAALKQARGESP